MTTHARNTFRRINCLDVAEHVQRELDVRLSAAAFRRIKAHLKHCPNCTAYLDSLKKTILLYRRVPCPPLSRKAEARLFSVLNVRLKAH